MVLHLRVPAPGDWRDAKCRGQVRRLPGETMVYDPFFHEYEDGRFDELAQQDAIDFCNGTVDGVQCPIRAGCLSFALTNNERFGVYGGMTELARKALRKKWPWRGGKTPRPEWEWMPSEVAISLVTPEELSSGDDEADD